MFLLTLTLICNSCSDLNSENDGVVALALNTLSLIASEAMARELANEVLRLFHSINSNIRKKAAACASKLVQKDPELSEIFEDSLTALLSDKNHAVALTAAQLLLTISTAVSKEEFSKKYSKLCGSIVKLIKNLQSSTFNPEYDISGVCDPVLQVNLLKLLRKLYDPDQLEALNDLLAQLATTVDTTKSVGNAVIYEVVLTILSLPVDQTLKNLSISILGKFLHGNSSGDNNLRYVALNIISKVLSTTNARISTSANKSASVQSVSTSQVYDSTAQIQKLQSTILACLHDADSSIRTKSAEIALILINSKESLTLILPELLQFIRKEQESEEQACESVDVSLLKLSHAITKFTSGSLFINLYINLLKRVNSSCSSLDEIVRNFIINSTRNEKDRIYTVKELFLAMTIIEEEDKEGPHSSNSSHSHGSAKSISSNHSTTSSTHSNRSLLPSDGLLQAAFWYFGELGQILPIESLCSAADLISLLLDFVSFKLVSKETRLYSLTALGKLSLRLPEESESIRSALLRLQSRGTKKMVLEVEFIDRIREILEIILEEKICKVAFSTEWEFLQTDVQVAKETEDDIIKDSDSLILSESTKAKAKVLSHPPQPQNSQIVLKFQHVQCSLEQSYCPSPLNLQLQLSFTRTNACTGPISDISVALAVPRDDFDFDYMAPLSGTDLTEDQDQEHLESNNNNNIITLSVLIKKQKIEKSSDFSEKEFNLLDLDLSESESQEPSKTSCVNNVNWNRDCRIKVKLCYKFGGKDYQEIGQLDHII